MFLATKKETAVYWLEASAEQVAKELADGSTNKYWLIVTSARGVPTLKPVVAQAPATISTERVEIVADGNVVGSAEVTEPLSDETLSDEVTEPASGAAE